MEDLDSLFRGAKRIKPPAGLWARIAGRSGLAPGRRHDSGRRHEWAWRMAATFAVGLGVIAALLVLDPGLGRMASGWMQGSDRDTLALGGGAEDFSSLPLDGSGAGEGEVLLDQEVLDWHADLGEVTGWDDDESAAYPMAEER